MLLIHTSKIQPEQDADKILFLATDLKQKNRKPEQS